MSNNGTLNRGTASFAAGKFGNALTGGVYYLSAFASISAGTVEGWVKTTATSVRVFFGNDTKNFWVGVHSNGAAAMGNPSTYQYGTTPINDGAWHHVAMTVDSTNGQRLWVDGALQTLTNQTAGPGPTPVTSIDLTSGQTALGGYGAATGFDWSGAIDEVRVSNVVRYTTNFTPPAAAFTSDSNTVALYHLESDATDSATGTPTGSTIACNDANIAYSPGTWDVTSARAKTINVGARFRFEVAGGPTDLTLNFDVSAITSPNPILKYRVDQSGWVTATLAANVALTIPSNGWAKHVVEVVVASSSEFVNRWSPQATGVALTSITSTGNGVTTVPVTSPTLKVLIFGDSITEGYKSVSNATTPDGSDVTVCWSHRLGQELGADVGVVGFGGLAWLTGGQGGVPALPSSYNLLWSGGPARTLTGYDLVLVNMGRNDGTNDTTAAVTAWLNSMLAAISPTCLIGVMRPLSGLQAANLQTAIAACSSPNRVKYIDTTGWFSSADSADGVHPYGYVSVSTIAPLLAAACRTLLRRGAVYIAGATAAADKLVTPLRV